ncbi:MAG: type II secretion system major pseudopilin GspG [Gammaproteobacteria bacterium]|nr:type II secretion system major pseudopilin GspG [Gammaproteobacteria bacterium]
MNEAATTKRRVARAGFTLIELLAVIVILGLIAAVAVPQVLKWVGGAKSDSARIQIEALGNSIDLYRLEVGNYPPSLEALIERPPGVERWNGPYLKKNVIPKDPWGNDYVYTYPGKNGAYDLVSLGSDNAVGGDGERRDIVSWE